jgi:Mrp family chromosome partitioning ATPase
MHYRWLILAITVVAVLGSALHASLQSTTYTGTSALTVLSGTGNPDVDAHVAQGYVEYFNQGFASSRQGGPAAPPPDVTLSARTSATSALVYIEATAPTAELAGSSALTAAHFRDTVNAGLRQNVDRTVAELNNKLDEVKKSWGTEPASQSGLVAAQIDSLQNEIIGVQSRGAYNQLQDLSLDPVVTSTSPRLLVNVLFGLVGGLILGAIAALVLGSVEARLITPYDVSRRLEIDTIASITGRTERLRVQQLKRLAMVVGLAELRRPTTLVVTSVEPTTTSPRIAESIAHFRALQGERTLLIRADLHRDPVEQRPDRLGLGEFLSRSDLPLRELAIPGAVPGMLVVEPGHLADDPYSSFTPAQLDCLLEQAAQLADLVVVDAPAFGKSPEAHAICAVAERTLLVLESGATRARDAAEACDGLDQVKVNLWAAVIASAEVSRTPLSPGRPGTAPEVKERMKLWSLLASAVRRSNGSISSQPSSGGASTRA